MKRIVSMFMITALSIGLLLGFSGCSKPGIESGENTEGQGQGQSQTNSESTVDIPEEKIETIGLYTVNESISSYAMIGDEYARPVDMRISAAKLTDEYEDKYPELDKVLEEIEEGTFNEVPDQILSKNMNFIEELQSGGDPNRRYYDYSDLRVMRSDSKVVSLLFEYESYSGGDSELNLITTTNINPLSGERIDLFDIVEDEEKFIALAGDKLMDFYLREPASDLVWSLGNEGVTIFYNEDVPGSDIKDRQVTIDFATNPGVFKEEYTKTGDSYIFPITEKVPAFIDVDKDGEKEYIFLSANAFEDDYGEVELTVNGESHSFQYGFYEPECYIVCQNGKYFLYIFCSYENDYRGMRIVDLSKMEEMDEYFGWSVASGGYESGSYEEEETGYEISYYKTFSYALTNPVSMMLSSHMDFLGTWQSSAEYHLEDDSPVPVLTDGIFYRNDLSAFLARREVKCERVNPDGSVVEETTIPEGTFVVMKRTDGESYADLQIVDSSEVTVDGYADWSLIYTDEVKEFDEDEPIYRVKVESIENEYYRNVDGSPESAVFDGIMYAG